MNKNFTSGDIEIEVRYGGITITNWATPSHTDIPEEKFSDLRLAFAEWCISTLEPEPLMAPLCQEARDKMGVPTCFNRNCPRCYSGRLPLDQHVLACQEARDKMGGATGPETPCPACGIPMGETGCNEYTHVSKMGECTCPFGPEDAHFPDCPHHSPAYVAAAPESVRRADADQCREMGHEPDSCRDVAPGVFCAYCDWKGATVTDLGKHSLDHPEHWPTPSEDEAWDRRLDEMHGAELEANAEGDGL